MRVAPTTFQGSLADLYREHIEPALPRPEAVEHYHRLLVDYAASEDPLFIVRYVRGQVRGQDCRGSDGSRLRPADNSPGWWMLSQCWANERLQPSEFEAAIEPAPTHMFGTGTLRFNPNRFGWHVAHLFDAKDRNTAFDGWDRAEVTGRFFRTIHPANMFLVPKTSWQKYGGHPAVLSFVAEQFSERYGGIWEEFLAIAGVTMPRSIPDAAQFPVTLAPSASKEPASATPARKVAGVGDAITSGDLSRPAARTYRASRLTFKRDVIEGLGPAQVFRCVTPVGTFEMTKAEFYEAFPNVLASSSYRDGGNYNYSVLPGKAERFRVG